MNIAVGIGHASNAGARITLDGLAPALKIHADYGVSEEIAAARPEVKIFGRWVLDSDDDWRQWIGNPIGFYQHYFRSHVLANRKIRYWSTGLNEDSRKLLDNPDYQTLALTGDVRALAAWLEKNYFAYVPGIDRSKFPNAESPDFGDYVLKAQFEIPIMEALAADGVGATCLAVAVGNPSGSPEEQRGVWRAYHAAIAAAKRFGGMIDLHAYGNVSGWEGPVQTLIDHMTATGVAVPIIFGECGSEPGYRRRMREGDPSYEPGFDSAKYLAELIGYDDLVRRRWPSSVIAAFVFCANMGGWDDYSIEGDETVIEGLVRYGKATHNPTPAEVVGVDVSKWQDNDATPQPMNFAAAKARGAAFAFARASYGLTRDPDYQTNVRNMQAAGLLSGAYHFVTWADDPRAQAQHFYNLTRESALNLPLMLDFELDPFPTHGPTAARALIGELERLSGVKCGIYTRAEFWNRTLAGLGLEAGRVLWVASYNVAAPRMPRGWAAWEFWQYTSQGNGPEWGAESRYIDLNRFNGTLAQLAERYGQAAEPILFTIPARDPVAGTLYHLYVDPANVSYRRALVKWDMHIRERRVADGVEFARVTDQRDRIQLWLKVGPR